MNNGTRTENSLRNIKYAIIGQILGLIINFISRRIFVTYLGSQYLGINGLFSNILMLLSLAELGIGTSIVYSMYKPIATNDISKIKSLMALYKKAYSIIGFVVFFIGISLTPFLSFFISGKIDVPNINIIYILYVINSATSYFYTYKRSLIIAYQKKYITTIYRYGLNSIMNIIQIAVLILTYNYILYLSIMVAFTFIENVLISIKVDKLYPYIKEKDINPIDSDERHKIFNNVKAMMYHKIGAVVVNSTDNLLISRFVGVVFVGVYSNYILVKTAVETVLGLLFQSITASIGNLDATSNSKQKLIFFQNFNFLSSWIYGFSSICLIVLFNPFIELWLGTEYLFDFSIVLIIVINFYLTGMRQSVLTTRNAMGLFWYDRYKAIFEAIINLIVSIILVKNYGIMGVIIGTIISTITTCFWVEPYVLYKYGFKDNVIQYFGKYCLYTLVTILNSTIVFAVCNLVSSSGFISFVIKVTICAILPNIIYLLFYFRFKECKYLINIINNIIFKRILKY